MPILYPIAACFLFVNYWVDKFLIIYYHRKPVSYDSYITKKSGNWYKFILVMHVIAGTLMYANSSIVPSRYLWKDSINKLLDKTD